MSGRPVLAFGVPRYGHNAPRHALVFFETGKGWREANNFQSFDVTYWQPLDEPPLDATNAAAKISDAGGSGSQVRQRRSVLDHSGAPINSRSLGRGL